MISISLNLEKEAMIFRIQNYLGLVLICILGIIPLIDLMHPGLPVTHDGQDHVARIANFYQSLTEGNIVPRWAENLNWGYGHPILMFLYPFPSYIASVFHLIGMNFTDSVKMVFAVTFILSGIGMYLWIRKILGETSGVVAGVLYLFAPYRFVDLYVRGAIGEHVAFAILPFVLYFLLRLSEKYSYWNNIGAIISLSFMFLSHNALSIMFLPIILFYAIYLFYKSNYKLKLFYNYAGILILGFGLSSFFLIPAFFEGKYTLRDIVTSGEYASRFVNFQSLIYGPWSYGGTGQFTVQLGIINWLMIVLSLVSILILNKRKKNILYYFFFIYFITSLFLMLKQSNFIWKTFTILQKFQFPWRFLSVSVFCSAVLGGFAVNLNFKKFQRIFLIVFIFLMILLNRNYFHANGYIQKSDEFYSGIYSGTTDTGESSPIWSVRFMENRPKAKVEAIEGQVTIRETERSTTSHKYIITSEGLRSRIKDNTLYFPGWKVFVDGKEVPVEFQDPLNRGIITFFVEKGKHNVNVIFQDTKLRKIADLISVFSLLFLIVYGFKFGLSRKLFNFIN